MMPLGKKSIRQTLCVLLLLAGVSCERVSDQKESLTSHPTQPAVWRIAWRATCSDAQPNAPTPLPPNNWVVSDTAGGVTALSHQGQRLWQTICSNQIFEAAAWASQTQVVVASLKGQVFAFYPETGALCWTTQLDARFQHQPLSGYLPDQTAVLWLVSQSDGSLFCLRQKDGKLLWQSDPVNRCDGKPTLWSGGLAYGNCDGAVHVFDSATGHRVGSVVIGSEDQMAGSLLALAPDALATGTRQGHLVVVNPLTLLCEARVKVSESEAFLSPLLAFDGLIAMGTQEGMVSFWRFEKSGLQPAGHVTVDRPVDALAFNDNQLFVLAGGTLSIFGAVDTLQQRLMLGDEVYGLTLINATMAACVADGAILCLKEARDE